MAEEQNANDSSEETWDPHDIFMELADPSLWPKLSAQSLELLQTDPIMWSTSRKRMLRAALVSGDKELFRTVLHEYVAVQGKTRGWFVFMDVWWDIAEEFRVDTPTDVGAMQDA